jgi:hypothetical protein
MQTAEPPNDPVVRHSTLSPTVNQPQGSDVLMRGSHWFSLAACNLNLQQPNPTDIPLYLNTPECSPRVRNVVLSKFAPAPAPPLRRTWPNLEMMRC